ncbi:MAG: DUF3800 domain-containing protein [Gammaproteobacteria bacterium]|nr:DUF3800 domain-containing protein [Gammaproteobacteria bacterium]
MFGDYEADEVTSAVVDFSEYKNQGKTLMYFGRPLGRLLDTVYFTQSHHSRFLQVSDLLVFMAGRYENRSNIPDRWHEKEVQTAWENKGQRKCSYSTLALGNLERPALKGRLASKRVC